MTVQEIKEVLDERPDVTHQAIMKRFFEHSIDLSRLAYYTESRSVQ